MVDLENKKGEIADILGNLNKERDLLKPEKENPKSPQKSKENEEEEEEKQKRLKALIFETEEKLRKFQETDSGKKEVSTKILHPTMDSIKKKRQIISFYLQSICISNLI